MLILDYRSENSLGEMVIFAGPRYVKLSPNTFYFCHETKYKHAHTVGTYCEDNCYHGNRKGYDGVPE